jgi:hypothetical protein
MIIANDSKVDFIGKDTEMCLDLANIIRTLRFRFEQHFDEETAEMLIAQAVEDSRRAESEVIEEMKQFQKSASRGLTKAMLF